MMEPKNNGQFCCATIQTISSQYKLLEDGTIQEWMADLIHINDSLRCDQFASHESTLCQNHLNQLIMPQSDQDIVQNFQNGVIPVDVTEEYIGTIMQLFLSEYGIIHSSLEDWVKLIPFVGLVRLLNLVYY